MDFFTSITGLLFSSLFTLVLFSGVFLLFLSLPGTWVILIASVVWGSLSDPSPFSWNIYLLLTALAIAGEIIEFFAGSIGAKKFGGSKKGGIGSIIGAIIGAIFGASFLFGIGALPGALIGAFIGSFLFEKWHKMPTDKAIKASLGASLGRFGGFIAKLGIAIAMIIIVFPGIWGYA